MPAPPSSSKDRGQDTYVPRMGNYTEMNEMKWSGAWVPGKGYVTKGPYTLYNVDLDRYESKPDDRRVGARMFTPGPEYIQSNRHARETEPYMKKKEEYDFAPYSVQVPMRSWNPSIEERALIHAQVESGAGR